MLHRSKKSLRPSQLAWRSRSRLSAVTAFGWLDALPNASALMYEGSTS
jgi:hypothetical protein